MDLLSEPSSERQFIMYEASGKGQAWKTSIKKLISKPWFIEQMKELVELEDKYLV